MKQILLELREKLQVSVWFVPALICVACLLLAILLLWCEREFSLRGTALELFVMPVAPARQLMAVIAGAVLSVGGVVFSVTMVALTLTSGQYGPKILRQFLGDNNSKLSLGMFMGTSLFCLMMLVFYEAGDQPGLTVVAALLLTGAAMAGFIRFIHSTATDLQADQIIERIGGELRELLRQLTREDSCAGRSGQTLGWRRRARKLRPVVVAASSNGYVQTIDYTGILHWLQARDGVGQLRVRAGDFLLEGNCLAKIYGVDSDLGSDDVAQLRKFVRTGPLRTPVQDPEYPITQLNQLAARALSPGINDPGTAITCVDWYSMAVARIVDRELPGKVFLDEQGNPRLLARYTDFAGITKAFYAPSRQFASDNIPVLISLLESLIRLAGLTTRRDRLAVISAHGDQLSRTIEGGGHMEYDLHGFRQRYAKLLRITGRTGVS